MSKILTDEELVAIFEDVKDQGHPDTWCVCGQSQVLAMVKELQAKRAADKRVEKVLGDLGAPSYIPLLKDDGGRSAHHHVVKVVKAAVVGDPEFESYWRS